MLEEGRTSCFDWSNACLEGMKTWNSDLPHPDRQATVLVKTLYEKKKSDGKQLRKTLIVILWSPRANSHVRIIIHTHPRPKREELNQHINTKSENQGKYWAISLYPRHFWEFHCILYPRHFWVQNWVGCWDLREFTEQSIYISQILLEACYTDTVFSGGPHSGTR